MKEYIETSLSFTSYIELFDKLLNENRSTGPEQTAAKVEFSRLNRARMRRLEKTLTLD
jgi:hypothetical protein